MLIKAAKIMTAEFLTKKGMKDEEKKKQKSGLQIFYKSEDVTNWHLYKNAIDG